MGKYKRLEFVKIRTCGSFLETIQMWLEFAWGSLVGRPDQQINIYEQRYLFIIKILKLLPRVFYEG